MGERIRVGAEAAWRKRITDPAVGGRVAGNTRKQSSVHRAIEPTIRSDARLAQILHYAVADELRNAEYHCFKNTTQLGYQATSHR